ncbi:hypothetical protein MMC28_003216 [Mycoblastus sanguinarius]|nr:hypothetical protein [Mycoblastus sanguinarius]
MKFSSAVTFTTVVSLLSATHAMPVTIKDGNGINVSPRNIRRGSDVTSASTEFKDELSASSMGTTDPTGSPGFAFEGASNIFLPRAVVNFFKRASETLSSLEERAVESLNSISESDEDSHNIMEGLDAAFEGGANVLPVK